MDASRSPATAPCTGWLLRLLAGAALGQDALFKVLERDAAIELHSELGVGLPGWLGIGAVELLAAVLLVHPRRASTGAIAALLVAGLNLGLFLSHPAAQAGAHGRLPAGLMWAVLGAATLVLVLRELAPRVRALAGSLARAPGPRTIAPSAPAREESGLDLPAEREAG